MPIRPSVSHELEENDKSKNHFAWTHIQNHISPECLGIFTQLMHQQNTQRLAVCV